MRPAATTARARWSVPLAALALALIAGAACKKKKAEPPGEPVPLAGLAAVPADATVVVGIDVSRLADSRLVARAVDQMLLRDPSLADRLARLATDCGVDVTHQIRTVHLALGPRASSGSQPSLMVATGDLVETTLTRCLQAGFAGGGAQVTVKDRDGRSLYKLTEGNRVLYFGFGQPDTVVLGPDEAWVVAALGSGTKVTRAEVLGPLLEEVDRSRAMWTVALMDGELGQALARITSGQIGRPPVALHGSLDPHEGLTAEVGFVMHTAGDGQALADFARTELEVGSMAAQAMGLGPLVAKVQVERRGAEVRLRVALTDDEVRQLLAAIDRGASTGQDAQPAPDAGVLPADPGTGPADAAPQDR